MLSHDKLIGVFIGQVHETEMVAVSLAVTGPSGRHTVGAGAGTAPNMRRDRVEEMQSAPAGAAATDDPQSAAGGAGLNFLARCC